MHSGRRKLLLADDSPTIQKVISLTFGEDDGFEVVAVGDGAQALRALAEEPPPDVVLADAVMPGPDGYELCEHIKRDERLKKVPVVLLVGTFEPFNLAEARRVGADTVLTKPFQSIRDLVSKVGSLLGGESKADEPVAEPREEQHPAASPAHAETAAHFDAEAREAEVYEESVGHRGEDPGASFADLGADDELIEARPAEAFGAASSFARRRSDASAEAESPEPDVQPAHAFETNVAHAPAAASERESDDDFALDVEEAGHPEPVFAAAQTRESVMTEPNAPRTSFDSSFDARAASAAAADDALLDLGQSAAPAAVATAEADDFILDLGFDDEPVAEPVAEVLDARAEESPAPVWADAPSAFAEAAHGESTHGESTHGESAHVFESASSFDSSDAQPEAAPWRDVVVQDGPQGFAFGGETQDAAQETVAAPRGFVEPEVVPADEPFPAASEFTDGSVEGDLPKPQEPTAAGFTVGEARAGVEEPLRADRLSPEAIETIARRVVELMSDKVVREIAWEVVPEMAELLIKQKLEEEKSR